jgi:hypothetical protein
MNVFKRCPQKSFFFDNEITILHSTHVHISPGHNKQGKPHKGYITTAKISQSDLDRREILVKKSVTGIKYIQRY